MARLSRFLLAVLLASTPLAAQPPLRQVTADRFCDHAVAAPSEGSASPDAQAAVRAQGEFENFRCKNLAPPTSEPDQCSEKIGQDCYWYIENAPLPPEPASIGEQRDRLIALLGSVAKRVPSDGWVAEQRVRYLVEAGRDEDALAAATACRAPGWTCEVLVGFSLHALGRYAAADSVYGHALSLMSGEDRCAWRRIDLLIDDETRQTYGQLPCGDPRRDAFEDRVWFFSRTLYSHDGNDSRTEHYARETMVMMLRDAPTIAKSPDDYLQLVLRFGWSRAWTLRLTSVTCRGSEMADCGGRPVVGILAPGEAPSGAGALGAPGEASTGDRGGFRVVAVQVNSFQLRNYEPSPAYRYVPPGAVLANPAKSDSAQWRLQLPPVIARYAPPYATSLTPLEHQKAMFKRGDTALVVMAYDARATPPLAGGTLTAALVVSPNEQAGTYGTMNHNASETGVLMARAPWGPLLMSAEVYAPEKKAVARARYGINPPLAAGTRVTLSDMLFYKPYGTFPASVEEAAPHALPTERLLSNEKLGIYWESYGTNPTGESMHVSLRVVKEVAGSGFFGHLASALSRKATSVVVSVEDQSARGASTTPRALEVDISTLKKGSYIVELEIQPAGQPAIRAEHRIEITGP